MTFFPELVERYIGAWNEADPDARRKLVDELCTEDARYVDPLVDVTGTAAIDATISLVQAQFAGMEFRLGGPVDAHHDIARFTWHLGPPGGAPIVAGFDVVAIASDGRMRQIHGFLDKIPTADTTGD